MKAQGIAQYKNLDVSPNFFLDWYIIVHTSRFIYAPFIFKYTGHKIFGAAGVLAVEECQILKLDACDLKWLSIEEALIHEKLFIRIAAVKYLVNQEEVISGCIHGNIIPEQEKI